MPYPYTNEHDDEYGKAVAGVSPRALGAASRQGVNEAGAAIGSASRALGQGAKFVADDFKQRARGVGNAAAYPFQEFAAGWRGEPQGLPQASYSNEGRGATLGNISYPAPAATPADDITGSAARIQAANPRGNYSVPQMARSLAQDSQQRFAPPVAGEGSIGVDGYMRQLQNIRALNDMTPQGGIGILHSTQNDEDAAWNAHMDRRSAMDDMQTRMRQAQTPQEAAAYGQGMNELLRNQGQQQLQDNRFGNELPRDMAREETQRRGQDMQLAATGLQGRNQLAAEQMRGQNQLATTGLQGQWQGRNQAAMDDRRFDNDRALKGDEYEYRRNDPLYQGQARQANAAADYSRVQTDRYPQERAGRMELDRQRAIATARANYAKSGLHTDEQVEGMLAKDFPPPLHTQDPAVLRKLMAEYEGYAEGGVVAPAGESRAQRMLREMNEKYGTGTKSTEPPPAPAGLPAPAAPAPRPTAVQNPAGWAEDVATGGLRRRMEGYAGGGDIPGGRAVAQAVAGRQVFGQSDGSGEDDALPAVVDGERPAALTSGEFVWPVKAVQFYGMDRLNKMLAAAEKGMAGKDEQA